MNNFADLITQKPNLIVTGVAHSGTSILAKMLIMMGWDRLEAKDETNVEMEKVYYLNQALITGGKPDWESIRNMLNGRSPWVMKDPHFAYTLGDWIPKLAQFGYCPTLVVITRVHDMVVESWNQRGEGQPDAEPHVAYAELMLRTNIEAWPWEKVVIDYENMVQAARLCSPGTHSKTKEIERD